MSAAVPLPWQFQLLDLQTSHPAPTLVPPPPAVESGPREALERLRAALDPAVAAKVRSGAELLRQLSNQERERSDIVPTTLAAVDGLLGGGLHRGKLVELVSRRAAGRFSIVLSALAAATNMGEAAALIDLGDHFDPQLAEANGVDLRRLLWVRPRTVKEAVMSAEMITATGFQLVIVDTGLHPLRGRRAPDAAWVRLARTAQAHGAAMLVSSPYPLTATASEAVMKASFSKTQWIGQGRSPRLLQSVEMSLTLEKHRHLKPGTCATQRFVVREAHEVVAFSRPVVSPGIVSSGVVASGVVESSSRQVVSSGVVESSSRQVVSSGVVKSSSRQVVEGTVAPSLADRELESLQSGEPEESKAACPATRRLEDSTTRRLETADHQQPATSNGRTGNRQPTTDNRRADGTARRGDGA